MDKTAKIRELNDRLRKTALGGEIMITQGVTCKDAETIRQVLLAVKNYNDFSEDNDPYGEHDFGAFTHDSIKYFWKIDYYDNNYQFHSPDATNPAVTKRVLTIFLAEEY